MRVLFIPSDNSTTSGAFLSMVTLIQLLRDRFSVVPFVVLPRAGEGQKLLEEAGIPYETVSSYDWVVPQELHGTWKCNVKSFAKRLYNLPATRKIARIAKRERSQLIHINTTYAYIGATAAQQAHLPYIWHLREFVEEDQGRTLWNREKGNACIAKADRVIAISSSVYEKYRSIVPADKLVTILNGIDCDRFYRPEKEIFQGDTIKLVYGGGYANRKGIYEFASALELLLEMGIRNFEVWFIGEPNRKYLAYLKTSGITSYARFLGYQKDVAQWYEQADIAFSCSQCEAFGRKTVEAMLCGTLMIAANTGGTLDIIHDGENGLMYQQGNPIDLAFKILYAMNNKADCQALAKNGRTYAYENLSALKNAQAVYEQYQQVVTQK